MSNIQLTKEQEDTLIDMSLDARNYAYCPYSKFRVGAALLTDTNEYFKGCNIENASFGAGVCAERCAFQKAISEGHRKFIAIAASTDVDTYPTPCGICRQFMAEFGTDLLVLLVRHDRTAKTMTLKELLPEYFGPKDLEGMNK
ncbi:cytidine deaminase [Basidiobolus meristosporus CBS 931.73]|uniref:Cytidine deaminase n=1 Tax=Basidiobolus meristosporus CBS 931.73 TaxID=1314790 RepID=A0A1Y1Z592_9FUNG|nr:cytidine deaminase [Basidiobolus meristosporus CBS 931.73]|eukprot:ORY05458.1 cytidine deaminase [Basidiobolus meristosporus CBS 931.73]